MAKNVTTKTQTNTKQSNNKKKTKRKNQKKKNNMKNIIMIIALSLITVLLLCSVVINIILATKKEKTKIIYKLKNDENIVFYGDSITSKYEIEHFFPNNKIINSGKSGDISTDLIDRINDDVYKYNPSKVFILIGINDLTRNISNNEILDNIQEIITGIKVNRKHSRIYIESIYPINKEYMNEKEYEFNDELENDDIINLNKDIEKLAKDNKITYIDIYSSLLDENGNLDKKYSKEGLHLNNVGYLKVSKVLNKYIKEK